MLQILVAVVLFTLLALLVAPLWWRRRRIAGVPGAHYLEQKCLQLAEDAWRDYRVAVPDFARRRHDPLFLGETLADFVSLFLRMMAGGLDDEVRLWLDDLITREGAQAAQRVVLSAALARENSGDRYRDPGVPLRAMQVALERLS